MPNQEDALSPPVRVIYHDRPGNYRFILLPNRELMQAFFFLAVNNSFC